jgi:uncharacterized repeat protein (TIGR01451 family)
MRNAMLRTTSRALTLLMLIAAVSGWLPAAPLTASDGAVLLPALSSSAVSSTGNALTPSTYYAIPPTAPPARQPSLSLDLSVAPDPIAVGETATVTLSIANASAEPANDLVVTDWEPLATSVDRATHTASATVNHFTEFGLSDGSSPSDAFIPSLQGWQVGLFTGGVSYSYPVAVPAGAGGLKPNLALAYNSRATDGQTGLRDKQQASWVGKGWSLDTGSVAHHKIKVSGSTTVTY